MAIIQLQVNDDQERILLVGFEENLNFKESDSGQSFINFTFELNVSDTEDYYNIQNYISQYVTEGTINSLKIYKNNSVIHSTQRYDHVNALYLRLDERLDNNVDDDPKVLFTIHFEKDEI